MDQLSLTLSLPATTRPFFRFYHAGRWVGFTFVSIAAESVKSVVLLGENRPLAFEAGRDGISVDLPALSGSLLAQPAWVLKFFL